MRYSTRVRYQPARLINEAGSLISESEKAYLTVMMSMDEFSNDNVLPFRNTVTNIMHDTTLVGAAPSSGFANTQELIPMKYNEAMKTIDKVGEK